MVMSYSHQSLKAIIDIFLCFYLTLYRQIEITVLCQGNYVYCGRDGKNKVRYFYGTSLQEKFSMSIDSGEIAVYPFQPSPFLAPHGVPTVLPAFSRSHSVSTALKH